MALDAAQKRLVARLWADIMYGPNPPSGENRKAVMHLTDIIDAVTVIDNDFEGTPSSLPNAGTAALKNSLNQTLPEPFKTLATTVGKGVMLKCYADVAFGGVTG